MLISPPGDTILETIETLGMSQVELAERLGKPKEVVNKLIKGTEPISSATAYKLQMALGIEAGFWINRESRYRYQLFLRKKEKENEQQKTWLKRFPLRQLKANNLIPKSATTSENLDALLAFFGVGSVEQWERIYMAQEVSVAFRISLASTKCPYALSTWLRLGEKQATGLALADYNKVDFRSSLDSIKELAFQQSVDFQLRLQETCATSGVAVVFTPNLPKAPVSGATRWYRGNPLIQLSGRYKTDDHFWCTFFHEAAHVLLHGKKDVFLEDVSGVKPNEAKEAEEPMPLLPGF
jgi:plasmid maintenance system antidote protein VapI